MKKFFFAFILIAFSISTFSQKFELKRVEPAYWWVGMKNPNLQLLIYGKNIASTNVKLSKNTLVKIKKINKVENPNYLFIDFDISKAVKPEKFSIIFKTKNNTQKFEYELKTKKQHKRGFSSEDLIYLIMPDRFANGNPKNDSQKSMLEKGNRKNSDGRHGGDIQGVINHLDYIKELGATTVWLNPTIENNNKNYSYHGYGITDFYKTDARSGTNDDYKKLAGELHKKDMKIIMDMIFNHCGINHWWAKDLPMKNWFNSNPNFISNFRGSTVADPHASKEDKYRMVNGWFVSTMPDLNQHNQFLATYLIQNSIWWVEFAGLDGIRMDTYPYPFKDFMAVWTKRLHKEYPDLTLLGETWLQKTAFTAYFSANSPISGNYKSGLNSTTDFPLYYATKDAFNEKESWTGGLLKLYYVLAEDFLYGDANNNVVFLDNHDLERYFTSVKEDIKKFKMGIAFLLTVRGIPVMYYGTEILKTGYEHKGHGHIRTDFPGGWKEDKSNAFKKEGRTDKQNDAFNYIKKIAKFRKSSNALKKGKLLHFLPENNTYVYFRYTKNEAVMVILNNNDKEKRTIDCMRFDEILKNYKYGVNILTDEKIKLEKIEIPAKSALILNLKK